MLNVAPCTVGRTVERSYVHIFRLDGLLLFRIIMGLRCALHYNFFIFFKHSFTYVHREQYTVVKAILFQPSSFKSALCIKYIEFITSGVICCAFCNKIINALSGRSIIHRESIKYSFLKSHGKFRMCFTCATYTDLSFLITDEIPRVWLN